MLCTPEVNRDNYGNIAKVFANMSHDDLLDHCAKKFGSQKKVSWYCLINDFFEYPTKEFIAGLAQYTAERSKEISAQEGRITRILEVCAGRGHLSFLLDKALREMGVDCEITPVDDFTWDTNGSLPSIAKNEDGFAALHRVEPDIVMGAWLPGLEKEDYSLNKYSSNYCSPRKQQWTIEFGRNTSVKEFWLIGGHGTHANSEAWDIPKFDDNRVNHPSPDGIYRMPDLPTEDVQLCWLSGAKGGYGLHVSGTAVFQRLE